MLWTCELASGCIFVFASNLKQFDLFKINKVFICKVCVKSFNFGFAYSKISI